MAFTVPFKSFNGGEISPDIGARTDQAKYQSGLSKCRNFFPRLEGSVSNRSGTKFVCPMPRFFGTDTTSAARLFPFVFNDDQSYQILMHAQSLGGPASFMVIKNGEPIKLPAVNITAITAAFPPLVTAVAHGLATNDLVYLSGVGGMSQVDWRWFRALVVTADTFELLEEGIVNGVGYTPFTSGGIVQAAYVKDIDPAAELNGAGIATARYTQSADTLTIAGEDFPPFNIVRIADDNWLVEKIVFDPKVAQPDGGAISVTVGAVTLRYRITAIDEETLEESFPGYMAPVATPTIVYAGTSTPVVVNKTAHGYFTGDEVYFYGTTSPMEGKKYVITVTGANAFTLNGTNDGGFAASYGPAGNMARTAITTHTGVFPTSVNTAILTWTAVPGASNYNVYRETNGVYSYIGTAVGNRFEDLGYTADSLNTPPIPNDRFDQINEYPGAVGYYQQRLILGGALDNPEEVSASRIGSFYNFTRSNPIQADDAISWIMASGQVNQVRHVADMGKLLVFTQGAVFSTEGDDAGTLRPTAINPRKRADYGIGDIAPLTIGQLAMYIQPSGKIVREMDPSGVERYGSRDLTSFAKHLFENDKIVSWSYAEEPYGIIWCAMASGKMLGLTYLKEHNVDGWHQHDTGNGDSYLDVSCIPEGGETATYVLVSRKNCNGHTRTYCERMAARTVLEIADGRFLDCFTEHEVRDTEEPIAPPVLPPIEPPVILPPMPSPPVITSPLTASLTEDTLFSYTITATGTGPITFGVPSPPAWMTSFNPTTGVITGTPPDPGTFNITITATNAGGTDTETLVVTVNLAIGNNTVVDMNAGVEDLDVDAGAIGGALIYVCGAFTTVWDRNGSYTRNRLACLNASTGLWTSWDPNSSQAVNRIHIHTDGTIFAGCTSSSSTIGGTAVGWLARLSPTTGAVLSAPSQPSAAVNGMASSGTDLYICGGFGSVGGQTRGYAARLSNGTTVDGWDPRTAGGVRLNLQMFSIYPSGSGVYIAGQGGITSPTGLMAGVCLADASTGIIGQMTKGGPTSTNIIGRMFQGAGGIIVPTNLYQVQDLPSFTLNASNRVPVMAGTDVGTGLAPVFAGPDYFKLVNCGMTRSDGTLLLGTRDGWTSANGNSSMLGIVAVTTSGATVPGFAFSTRLVGTPNVRVIKAITGSAIAVAIGNASSYDGTAATGLLIINPYTGARY